MQTTGQTSPEPAPTAAPAPPAPAPAPTPADALRALVAAPGAACPHCQYSLTGLAAKDQPPTTCPECGGGLAAGLVGSTGPTRLRRVMTLMFAWLAFAGCMNAVRRGLLTYDLYLGPNARLYGGWIYAPNSTGMVTNTPGGAAAVPMTWWLELGGWTILGLLGIGGVLAASLLASRSPKRERSLVSLLVLGFIGYWGYHGFQFATEIMQRL